MEKIKARKTLKKIRLEKGFKVAEIASKIGVTPSVYYKWEDGSRDPLIENAKLVAEILGSTIEELFFTYELDESSNKASISL